MIQDVAVISHDDVGCMELAVIAEDIIGMIERILQWATIDDESLAVDVIAEVGPAGHFLSQKHTRKFLKREFYFPRLFNRQSLTAWVKAGAKDLSSVATEKAKEILSEHHPEPLPKGVRQKLTEIVKEAEKELIRT